MTYHCLWRGDRIATPRLATALLVLVLVVEVCRNASVVSPSTSRSSCLTWTAPPHRGRAWPPPSSAPTAPLTTWEAVSLSLAPITLRRRGVKERESEAWEGMRRTKGWGRRRRRLPIRWCRFACSATPGDTPMRHPHTSPCTSNNSQVRGRNKTASFLCQLSSYTCSS